MAMSTDQAPSDIVRSLFFHMSTFEQTRRTFDQVVAELQSANDREQQLQTFLMSNQQTNLQWMTDQLNSAEYVDEQMRLWFQTLQTTIEQNDTLIQAHPGLILGNPDLRKVSILQALSNKLTKLRTCAVCGRNPCICQYSISRSKQITPSITNTRAMTSQPSAEYESWNGSINAIESVLTQCQSPMQLWYKIQALSAWGIISTEWRSLLGDWSFSMRIRLETGDWNAGLVESAGALSVEKMLRIYLHYDSVLFRPNTTLFDSDIVNSLKTAQAGITGNRLGIFIQDATGTHITFDSINHPFLWQSETDVTIVNALSKYVRKDVRLKVDYKDGDKRTTLSWVDANNGNVLFSEQTALYFQDWNGTYLPICFTLNKCEMYVTEIRIDERQVQQTTTLFPDASGSTCTPNGAHLGETAGCIGHTLW
jgi:hypothetical protein